MNSMPMNPTTDRIRQIAWILAAAALFLVLRLHLLAALLAGLLVHELVHLIAPTLQRRRNRRINPAAKSERFAAAAQFSV